MRNSSCIGIDKEEIETPALLIDLDILEKNIETMASFYHGKKDATLRPHQKGHRLPIIARKQMDAGAKGVSMTSLGLCEYYVDCGITDVLVTSEVYGLDKTRRLCSLSKHAKVIVGVDNINNVRQISQEALKNNTEVNVAIELYMGTGSCGVEFENVKSLAEDITEVEGVRFRGLWWHQGSLISIRNWEKRKDEHFATLEKVAILKDEIEDAGIGIEMCSGGYTCTWNITPLFGRLRNVEVQAGHYVFSDWCSHELEGLESFDCALTVLTRCISRPKSKEALFDFGMNSCSDENANDYHSIVGPMFKNLEGIGKIYQREEISLAVLENSNRGVKVGEVFEIIPPHSDTTAKLHDKYYCIRNEEVEAVWPNYGRGLF